MPLDTERLLKSIRQVKKFLKKAPKNPTPQQIHDVRTATRRLEAALDTLGINKKGVRKKLERHLRRIRKRCGKIRDMDVFTWHALSLTPEGSERECLVQLLEYLGASRFRYAKKLRKAIKGCGAALRQQLAKLAQQTDELGEEGHGHGALLGVDGQNASALSDLAAVLQSPPQLDKKTLHPYRLTVKELRYALQLSEQARDDEFVATLGKVKDAIGEWHDWEELVTIATGVLRHGPQCKLLRQLKGISGEKFEEALEVTNRMRGTYVHGKRRRKGGRSQIVPFPVIPTQAARA